jgi:hypothetical protein
MLPNLLLLPLPLTVHLVSTNGHPTHMATNIMDTNDIDINPGSAQLVSSRNVNIREIPHPNHQPLSTGFYQSGNITYRQLFQELGLAFGRVADYDSVNLNFGVPLNIDRINRVSLYQPGSSLGIIARDCSPDILDSVVLPGGEYYIFEHFREYCDFENEMHPDPSEERCGGCCLFLELWANGEYFIEPTEHFFRQKKNEKQQHVTADPKVAHVVPLILEEEMRYNVEDWINDLRRERGLPEIEDDEPLLVCRENTLVLLPEESRLFELYLWTVEPVGSMHHAHESPIVNFLHRKRLPYVPWCL